MEPIMPKPAPLPPIERLQALFECDCTRGKLIFRPRAVDEFKSSPRMSAENAAKAFNALRSGKPAGHPDGGRVRLYVDGRRYWLARVLWRMCKNEDPGDALIDHADGATGNNCELNLRKASGAQNAHNRGLSARNTSGFAGVHFEKFTGRWKAQLGNGYRNINLGRFDTPEEAHQAYLNAKSEVAGEFFPSLRPLSRPTAAPQSVEPAAQEQT
ncbi:hypothetical protein A8B73_02855 [Methylosinus sp. 3S-1]|nr:hypothetical protein A8B73_02855 [Methylosinus sp. 3S-1]